jgi:hypothetical protein
MSYYAFSSTHIVVPFSSSGYLFTERLKTISDNTARLRAYNASALDAAHAQVRRVALSPRSLPPHTSPSHRALDAAHAQLSKFVEEWAAAKVGSLTRPLSKPLYRPLSKPLYSPP